MEPFAYNSNASRVVFGPDSIDRIPDEIGRLGAMRALVLCTPNQRAQAEAIAARLGDRVAGIFDQAQMHVPIEVARRARAAAAASRADCALAVGGGSTIGLGKAIALRTDLMQFAIPTTYAGSEMTPIIGETRDGAKTTQRSLKVLPEVVIYDVDLTLTLPAKMSATSGMNAIAHAVEALYAQDRNPVMSLMAEEAIRALGRALPVIVASPQDREARSDALYGAWLCGMCLGSVGMALHHKLCHVLGGSFELPHAETHTVILPHAFAYNAAAAHDADARIARALGGKNAALDLFELSGKLGAPRSLKSLGMPEDGIEKAADIAVKNPYWNPRPIERNAIRDLIARAWAGDPPRQD
jgi:maleylacetate reductase